MPDKQPASSTVPQTGRGIAVRVQKPTYSRKWKCPRCSHTVSHSYESLAEVGTPYCADCEIEMELV